MLIGAAVPGAPPDFLEGGSGDWVNRIARGEVGLDLLLGQRGLEQCDQIAGADHIFTQAANQIDGPAIHQ